LSTAKTPTSIAPPLPQRARRDRNPARVRRYRIAAGIPVGTRSQDRLCMKAGAARKRRDWLHKIRMFKTDSPCHWRRLDAAPGAC
jgi:hypothetical protein